LEIVLSNHLWLVHDSLPVMWSPYDPVHYERALMFSGVFWGRSNVHLTSPHKADTTPSVDCQALELSTLNITHHTITCWVIAVIRWKTYGWLYVILTQKLKTTSADLNKKL